MGPARLPGIPFLHEYPILAPISLVLTIFPVIFSSMSHYTTFFAFLAAKQLSPFRRATNTLVPMLTIVVVVPRKKNTQLHQSQGYLVVVPSCLGILS